MALPWTKAFIDPSELLGMPCGNATAVELGDCVDPTAADQVWGMIETLTLMGLYAFILFKASNMLSEGSELLLLVPSLAGLVGERVDH